MVGVGVVGVCAGCGGGTGGGIPMGGQPGNIANGGATG